MAAGYVLLGSCWLILKTEDPTRAGARKWARRALIAVGVAMAAVSVATLSIDPRVTARWGVSLSHIDLGKALTLAPVPLAASGLVVWLWRDIKAASAAPDWRPIVLASGLFLTGYLGLALSIFPYNVPFAKTIWETAARDNALGLMLVGAGVMLPVILIYTAYVYRLFWGKVRVGDGYHA